MKHVITIKSDNQTSHEPESLKPPINADNKKVKMTDNIYIHIYIYIYIHAYVYIYIVPLCTCPDRQRKQKGMK